MASQSEAGLAVSSISIWTVGRSGYPLWPWLIHLGNGILQVKRSADAAVWRVPMRCTRAHAAFTHTNDRQKMGTNSYQVQPGSSQDLRALSQWKVMKILWGRRFSDERAETQGSSVTCPIVTAFHVPRAEPVISDLKAPHKTRACELEAKPSSLFLFYSSSKVHGPFSKSYFVIHWELVNSIYLRLRWEDYEEKASYLA